MSNGSAENQSRGLDATPSSLKTPSQSPSLPSLRSAENTPRQHNNRSKSIHTAQNRKIFDVKIAQLPLPLPRDPTQCPLFCCFYAEFDNRAGPKIVFQSPKTFMDQEIQVPAERVHKLLEGAFEEIQLKTGGNSTLEQPATNHDQGVYTSGGNSGLSIFDSCKDYIITGNELTGTVINLSSHEMHVLTRPTIIHNEAYERNSFLFSVGFVLRRSSDPRPFQPIISKWAQSLQHLEMETRFLSNLTTRPRVQSLLEQILVSLNSINQECNLAISPSCVLHLRHFQPPRTPAHPVPDYAVPVLLLRDWRQCQAFFDWDLSIDWCARHIDGVRNAKQISEKAEVDIEIVRACLRVLKHYGVIALCDMFFYSNRYETTEIAMRLLAGKEQRLLASAVEHAVAKADPSQNSPEVSPSLHPAPFSPGTEGSLGSSSRTTDRERMAQSNPRTSALPHTPANEVLWSVSLSRREDFPLLKAAVADFYSLCERRRTFGETWISLVDGTLSSRSLDWKRMFQILDHRRLASFGVVHGLIRRVHRFPRMVRLQNATISSTDGVGNGGTSRSQSSRPHGRATAMGNKRKPPTCSKESIGAKMDGRHCDDELVCEFQKSLAELLEIVGEPVSFILAPSR